LNSTLRPHNLGCDRDLDCDLDCDLDRSSDIDEYGCSYLVASRRAAAMRGDMLMAVRRRGLAVPRSLALSRGRKKSRMSSSGLIERPVGAAGLRGAIDS
jgi:hypothetical protein